jgi:hypothetical protein
MNARYPTTPALAGARAQRQGEPKRLRDGWDPRYEDHFSRKLIVPIGAKKLHNKNCFRDQSSNMANSREQCGPLRGKKYFRDHEAGAGAGG